MDHLDSLFTVTTWSYSRDVFFFFSVCNSGTKKQPGCDSNFIFSTSTLLTWWLHSWIRLLRKDFCKQNSLCAFSEALGVKPARDSLPAGSEWLLTCWSQDRNYKLLQTYTGFLGDCDTADSCMGNYTLHVPFKFLEIPPGYQCLHIYLSPHTAVSMFGWN